jgi:galactokinase/mevalonate kinase-like predicted kinase
MFWIGAIVGLPPNGYFPHNSLMFWIGSIIFYLQALIKAVYVWRGENITEFEVCKIAEMIERKFNPLVGQQDFYGSMGGLKRINFFKNADPEIKYLNTKIFSEMDIHLLYTGVLRNSTKVLESLDIDKSVPLFKDVENLEKAINHCDIAWFNSVMRDSWEKKKQLKKRYEVLWQKLKQ